MGDITLMWGSLIREVHVRIRKLSGQTVNTKNLKVISFSHVRIHILLVELLFPVNTYDAFYLNSRQYLTKSPAG